MSAREGEVIRVRDGRRDRAIDHVAVEAPLEIRLHGRPFAVVMRTPGADRELAAGFLFAERVFETPDQIGTIEYCRDLAPLAADAATETISGAEAPSGIAPAVPQQVVNVRLVDVSDEQVAHMLVDRRQVLANAACGVCGRVSIDDLKRKLSPLPDGLVVADRTITGLPDALRVTQRGFDTTGGLHAAALFTADGRLTAAAEDIGRHSAVDKIVGRMLLREAVPLQHELLFVSGRTSFEIVQKAWCAGIALVASVSAPSSLAIDVAREANMTLVGFVRDGGYNIYTHADRIR